MRHGASFRSERTFNGIKYNLAFTNSELALACDIANVMKLAYMEFFWVIECYGLMLLMFYCFVIDVCSIITLCLQHILTTL